MSNSIPRNGFLYDTNEQNLLLTQKLNVTFENPAGSGKKIIIEGYSFINQASTFMMASFIHMPTGNLPTTTYAPLPYVMDTTLASDNVGIFKASISANAITGGTTLLGLPLEPAARNYIESTPLTLLPGVKIGLSINALIAAKVTVAIYTREENL